MTAVTTRVPCKVGVLIIVYLIRECVGYLVTYVLKGEGSGDHCKRKMRGVMMWSSNVLNVDVTLRWKVREWKLKATITPCLIFFYHFNNV